MAYIIVLKKYFKIVGDKHCTNNLNEIFFLACILPVYASVLTTRKTQNNQTALYHSFFTVILNSNKS